MSIPEIIINIAISLVTGLLTIIISKREESKGVPPLVYIKEIHKEIHYSKASNRSNSSKRKQAGTENSSDNDFWLIIIGMLFAVILITKLFATYREDIIFWGWRVIVLTGSIVITSLMYDVIRVRKLEFTKLLTLVSWGLAVFVFWVFDNPNIGPEYFQYLEAVKQEKDNVGLNNYSFFALYQVGGLFILSIVLLINLFQSLIIFSWPVAYNHTLLFNIILRGKIIFNNYFIILQFFLLVLSYLFVSGTLIHLIDNNSNYFLQQILHTQVYPK